VTDADATPEQPSRPILRVVRGEPTAEELAAVVTVLLARGADEEPAPAPRSLWSIPTLRGHLPHGPGAWRASGLPR
jgi:hypothetical protein